MEEASSNLEANTAQYVDVRLERKQIVLDAYHKALHPKKAKKPEAELPKSFKEKVPKLSDNLVSGYHSPVLFILI
jgi:integrase